MLPIIGVAEKNTVVQAPRVVTCVAGVAVVAFPDQRYVQSQTIAKRWIQNTGAQNIYYTIGVGGPGSTTEAPVASCDNILNYHGYIAAGNALDCGASLQMVSLYSPAGSTAACVLVIRN